jgi:outer membrane protein assembly factor BamD (BamD/ComL family)
MIWKKKKSVVVLVWLSVSVFCFFRLGWPQKIAGGLLKDKMKEAEESYSTKDYAKAEEAFTELSGSFPLDPRFSYFQFMIAKCEYHLKNYDSAQVKLTTFNQQFPHSLFVPASCFLLGNIDYFNGRYFESAQNFVRAYHLARDQQLRDLSQRSLEGLLEKWLSNDEL